MTSAEDLGFDELQVDAITELVNIGVSRAALSLRQLVGEEVILTVPSLAICSRAEAADMVSRGQSGLLVAVRQAFEGSFAGRALLIFPETNSLEFIRAVAGRQFSLEDVVELEQEALAEIGNIVLNSSLRPSRTCSSAASPCRYRKSFAARARSCLGCLRRRPATSYCSSASTSASKIGKSMATSQW
jgi:hypothetical protein